MYRKIECFIKCAVCFQFPLYFHYFIFVIFCLSAHRLTLFWHSTVNKQWQIFDRQQISFGITDILVLHFADRINR